MLRKLLTDGYSNMYYVQNIWVIKWTIVTLRDLLHMTDQMNVEVEYEDSLVWVNITRGVRLS
jgi:hypothetical protein